MTLDVTALDVTTLDVTTLDVTALDVTTLDHLARDSARFVEVLRQPLPEVRCRPRLLAVAPTAGGPDGTSWGPGGPSALRTDHRPGYQLTLSAARSERLTADTTAFSEAITMFASRPTPHSTRSPTAAST